ncbi:MAG: hypothetical protein GC155_15150 [Alphaproteobacteria bacterium]|nr:hypothetical protein [Alphaproteobacteria bacterium]
MAAKVSVLQAVMAVSIGALAFKGVDFAQAAAQQAEAPDPAASAAAADSPLTAGAKIDSPSGPNAGEQADGDGKTAAAASCPTGPDYSEAGISAQEINVLRSLADRRKTLDDREANIETREQTAAAAEARLQDQIGELKALQGDMQKLLASMEEKKDERMAALIKTYESMKPKDAAKIFDGMDDKILIDLAKGMKPASLATVMAAMDASRAQALTKMLADLAQLPPNVEALKTSSG